MESWNRDVFAQVGMNFDFAQDNHSFSGPKGTLRGLHYQSPPFSQDKLVRCTQGAILDVAVDVRNGSPQFGKSFSVELTPENRKSLLVPKGFLHGFITLAPNTEVQYKCTHTYVPEADGSVRWDSLGVDWGSIEGILVSEKDAAAPSFDNWQSPFNWGEEL